MTHPHDRFASRAAALALTLVLSILLAACGSSPLYYPSAPVSDATSPQRPAPGAEVAGTLQQLGGVQLGQHHACALRLGMLARKHI